MTPDPVTRLLRQVAVSFAAAATAWFTLLSWRGFTTRPAEFVEPLLVLGLVLATTGCLLRTLPLHRFWVSLVQLLVTGLGLLWVVVGSPLPTLGAIDDVRTRLSAAVDASQAFAPPVPGVGGGVTVLLVVGGALCLWLADTLAASFRRSSLVGLPLLAVYSLPVTILGDALPWWLFVVSALGFLLLLALQESEEIAHWGRRVPARDDAHPTGRTWHLPAGGVAVAAVTTALAVLLPPVIPTLDTGLLADGGGFGQGGSSDEITIQNPMTDLRRDLSRGEDVDLLRIRTDDPDPSYLRISVLSRFAGNQWSSGDRDLPDDQTAQDEVPALEGVAQDVPRQEFPMEIEATDAFTSTWLPVPAAISAVDADAGWKFDDTTMDFIASVDDLTTRGATWSVTAVELGLTAEDLASASRAALEVDSSYLDLPSDLPPLVRQLAEQETADADTPFERAAALQEFFRETGGFEYELEAQPGNGSDELVQFLQERSGYCEQYASAMAVMARQLDIPARVAVGFLRPERSGDEWVYSAHDMHAWPELYFPGAGWVRFEPTPADRAATAPDYSVAEPEEEPTQPSPTSAPTTGTTPSPTGGPDLPSENASPAPAPETDDESAGGADGAPLLWPWLVGGGVVLLGVGLVVPSRVRRRRTAQRRGGDAEDAWAELRDSLTDHRIGWPDGLSPSAASHALVTDWESEVTARSAVTGAEPAPVRLDDEGLRALERLTTALELRRYAPDGRGPGAATLDEDVATFVAARTASVGRRRRWAARWFPRSVLTRSGAVGPDARAEEPVGR